MSRLRRISLELPLRGPRDIRRGLSILDFANRQYGPVPDIMSAGVRYRREPRGVEQWRTWPVVWDAGGGDCEDLASWLAAQLNGRAVCYEAAPRLVHCVTEVGGLILDPSLALGMLGEG